MQTACYYCLLFHDKQSKRGKYKQAATDLEEKSTPAKVRLTNAYGFDVQRATFWRARICDVILVYFTVY